MNAIQREIALVLGEKTYSTGIPCAKGHSSVRRTSNKACVECSNAHSAKWVKRNTAQHAAARAKWSAENPEKHQKARDEWLQANQERRKEKQAAWAKAWHLANKEEAARRGREWRARDPDRIAAKMSDWRKNNRGACNATDAKRRAALLQATPKWADMQAISEIYKRAALVGLQVDHIVPLLGDEVCGLHVENNLQLLSRAENSVKSNKFTETWP